MPILRTLPAAAAAAFLLFSPPSLAAEGDLAGWRGLTFGASMEEAKRALAALPKAGSVEESDGLYSVTLDNLDSSGPLVFNSFLAWKPWRVEIERGESDAQTLDAIWLSTETRLFGDGIGLIQQAQGYFGELVTALTVGYGPPDLILTDLTRIGLGPSVGRAVWRFENGASIVAIGQAGEGQFRPEIRFIGPFASPHRF
ncbi:MAG: hypothetical protein QNJ84_11785 [Alphaproteobacteria bacterium]|nr:hypothetical protein [Alphaproteobacteria bacterium]